jgi:hypothetical protein
MIDSLIEDFDGMMLSHDTNIDNIIKTILTNIQFNDIVSEEIITELFYNMSWSYQTIQNQDIVVGYSNINRSKLNMIIVEEEEKYMEQYRASITYYRIIFMREDPHYEYNHYFSITQYD